MKLTAIERAEVIRERNVRRDRRRLQARANRNERLRSARLLREAGWMLSALKFSPDVRKYLRDQLHDSHREIGILLSRTRVDARGFQ